jgi:hypothetical protein
MYDPGAQGGTMHAMRRIRYRLPRKKGGSRVEKTGAGVADYVSYTLKSLQTEHPCRGNKETAL